MNYILIALVVALVLGTIHGLRRGEARKINFGRFTKFSSINETEERRGLFSKIFSLILQIQDEINPEPSEVTNAIQVMMFLFILPIQIVAASLLSLIGRFSELIENFKAEVKEGAGQTEPKSLEGRLSSAQLSGVFCLIALAVFTVANYQILKLGLPLIFGFEKKFISLPVFGLISPISIMAILVILGEFFLGFLGAELRNTDSLFIPEKKQLKGKQDQKDKHNGNNRDGVGGKKGFRIAGAVVCYITLILFALAEAYLAMLRTAEIRGENLADINFLSAGGLLYLVVGFVSFVVPLMAAITFHYSMRYYIWLIAGIAIIVVSLIALPFVIALVILIAIELVLIKMVEFFAMPVRLIPLGNDGREKEREMESLSDKPKHSRGYEEIPTVSPQGGGP